MENQDNFGGSVGERERERESVKKSVANIHDFISAFLVGEREIGKERWVEVG